LKNFVIDTNVVINDPHCILKFGENNVIIPLVVLEEIDNFKKGNSSRAGAARTVTRLLDDLRERGRLDKGVELDNGGTLIVDAEFPEVLFTDTIDKNKNDNIILQSALNWSKGDKYDNVVLVTEDINLRVRADGLGVNTEGYQNTRVEDVSFYDEVETYSCSRQLIDALFADGYLSYPAVLQIEGEKSQLWSRTRGKDLTNQHAVLEPWEQGATALIRHEFGGIKVIRPETTNAYSVGPRNKEQSFALDLLMDPDISLVVLAGKAGCGKTLLALAAGLEQVIEPGRDKYGQLMISRPVIPMGRDIGFLPGTLDEKLEPWMAPIYDNMDYLHRGGTKETKGKEAVEQQIHYGNISIDALSYIRGRSLSNKYVLIDEAQNLSAHEIKTIVTRAGQNTKVVLTGDPFQIDNPYLDHYNNGLSYLIDRMRGQEMFGSVALLDGERSELAEVAAKLL
jgi:PhoH-like ATPase